MSDDAHIPESVGLQIVISFDPSTGTIGCAGHPALLGNKAMAYGLLEVAKEIIRGLHEQAEKPNIVVPFPGVRLPRVQ